MTPKPDYPAYRANADLRNKVRQLEARLATQQQSSGPSPDVSHGRQGISPAGLGRHYSTDSANPQSDPESPVDVLAAGVFDHPSAGSICYFGNMLRFSRIDLSLNGHCQAQAPIMHCSGRSPAVSQTWDTAAVACTRSLSDLARQMAHPIDSRNPPLLRRLAVTMLAPKKASYQAVTLLLDG